MAARIKPATLIRRALTTEDWRPRERQRRARIWHAGQEIGLMKFVEPGFDVFIGERYVCAGLTPKTALDHLATNLALAAH